MCVQAQLAALRLEGPGPQPDEGGAGAAPARGRLVPPAAALPQAAASRRRGRLVRRTRQPCSPCGQPALLLRGAPEADRGGPERAPLAHAPTAILGGAGARAEPLVRKCAFADAHVRDVRPRLTRSPRCLDLAALSAQPDPGR